MELDKIFCILAGIGISGSIMFLYFIACNLKYKGLFKF